MTEEELRADLHRKEKENMELCRLVFEMSQRLTEAAAEIEYLLSFIEERKGK